MIHRTAGGENGDQKTRGDGDAGGNQRHRAELRRRDAHEEEGAAPDRPKHDEIDDVAKFQWP